VTNSVLFVLSTNKAVLLFKLQQLTGVGNDANLSLAYSGTAVVGTDVGTLPSSVRLPAGATSLVLLVTAKANYPFSTKTLIVTITSSDNSCVVPGSPATATITLTGFAPPKLDATVSDASNIIVSWWAPVTGYVLQSSDTLRIGSWLAHTNPPTSSQGTNRFTLKRTGPAAAYRLVKP